MEGFHENGYFFEDAGFLSNGYDCIKCFPFYSKLYHLFLSQIEHQFINYYF